MYIHIIEMTNNDNSHPHFHRKSLNVEFHLKVINLVFERLSCTVKTSRMSVARTVLIVLQVKISYHSNLYYMT